MLGSISVISRRLKRGGLGPLNFSLGSNTIFLPGSSDTSFQRPEETEVSGSLL